MFCPAYIQTLQFSNVNIKKRISQQARNYYTYKLRLLHKLKDTNLSYLSKEKQWNKVWNMFKINNKDRKEQKCLPMGVLEEI